MNNIRIQKYRNPLKLSGVFVLFLGLNCLVFAQNAWILHLSVVTQNNLYAVSNNSISFNEYYQSACTAVGDSGTILYSYNGNNWSKLISGVKNSLYGLTFFLNSQEVLAMAGVGNNGTIVFSSYNETSFTLQESGTKRTLKAITACSHCTFPLPLVVVGDSGTILYSGNNSVWTSQASGTIKNLNAVFYYPEYLAGYSNGPFIAVGDSGTILTSLDGVIWTKQNSGTKKNLNAVSGGRGYVIAAGDSGIILLSKNLTTWNTQNSGTKNNLFGIYYMGVPMLVKRSVKDLTNETFKYYYFLIVGAHGTILSAMDSITSWKSYNSGTNKDLHSATAFYNSNGSTRDSLLIVGDSGTILTSNLPNYLLSKIITTKQSGLQFSVGSASYTLSKKTFVSINVYDLKGRIVKSIFNQMQQPGEYKINLPSIFSSGAYVLSLNVGEHKIERLIMAGR